MANTHYDVQHIAINASTTTVFNFLAIPENTAKWAKAFSKIKNEKALLQSPVGEVEIGFKVISNNNAGTIDYLMTFPDGSIGKAFSRVTENDSKNTSIYSFTLMAPPVPLEAIEGSLELQKKQLKEELILLKTIIEQ